MIYRVRVIRCLRRKISQSLNWFWFLAVGLLISSRGNTMFRNFLLFLVYWSCISSKLAHMTAIKDKCPSPENLRKCTCKIVDNGIEVTCRGFSTDAEVKQHLDALRGYTVEKLELTQFEASSVPTDLFKGLSIQILSLEKIDVRDASFRRGQRHLQGLEDSLINLFIEKSFRKDRPLLNFQLDHLEKLQVVLLEDNNIPEVGNDWFAKGPEELSVLLFERNNIEELGDQAFSALKNLKILAVAGNHLNSISRSMLPKEAHKLMTLDLGYNKIRKLPSDIFTGMPALKDINLEHNFIHVLEENTWSPVFSRLDELKLRGNSIKCEAELRWICETRNPKIFYGTCASPAEHRGLDLKMFCRN